MPESTPNPNEVQRKSLDGSPVKLAWGKANREDGTCHPLVQLASTEVVEIPV
jgi:hypothetical protein